MTKPIELPTATTLGQDDSFIINQGGALKNITVATTALATDEVLWTPSDVTGATDVAAELEAFANLHPGKLIKVPRGSTILLNDYGRQGILSTTNDVLLDFSGVTILYDAGSTAIFVSNDTRASSQVGVSSLVDKQINSKTLTTELTISSTLNLQAHDWIALYSEDANPSKSGGKLGEIHQIIDDETSLKIRTVGKVGRTSEFTTSVNLRKLDATRKLYIRGGTFKANGDADDLLISDREECIKIIGFVDPIIEDCTFDGPWAQCIWLQCTAGAVVKGTQVKNTLNTANSNGYTYGVVLYGMNGNATITNTVVRNGRHPGGTTDGNSSGTTTWYSKGYPTYYKFINTAAYNCYGSVGDSHEEGMYGLWDGLYDHNPVQDENKIFLGSLFQGRAAYETVRNFVSIGGTRGLVFDNVDHGFQDVVTISDGVIRNKHDGDTSAYGIQLKDFSSGANVRQYNISNVMMDDLDVGVYVGSNNKVYMDNITVARAELFADVKAGAECIVGHMTSDHRNTTAFGATSVFYCRSNVSDGGCKIICLHSPVVIKGSSSNQPSNFFDERDTNATKEVWHPGIIEYNPSGVTSTASKEAGATTFSNSTDVSVITL